MNPWKCTRYRRIYSEDVRKGIHLHFEKGIDSELRALFLSFAGWLRRNYAFPIRVNVYVKNCVKIRLLDGRMAYGGFRYWGIHDEPYIRIPAKPETELLNVYTKEEIEEQILSSFVHELTHYFQWINQIEQSDRSCEWQANYYRYRMIEQYKREKKGGVLQ